MLSNMTADDRVWIKLRDISMDNSVIYICFCYLPPRDSSVTCNNQSEWSHFESEVINMLTRGNILLCGDFNARTGTKCDYVNNDAELPIQARTQVVEKVGYILVGTGLRTQVCHLGVCGGMLPQENFGFLDLLEIVSDAILE